MNALEHLGQAVADDEQDRMDGGKAYAIWALYRLTALGDDPLLQLEDLIKRQCCDAEFIIV